MPLDLPSSNDKSPALSLDAHFVGTIRCTLAIAIALILALDTATRPHFSTGTYLIVGLYVTYVVLLCIATRLWRPLLPNVVEPWIDVGWAVGLMAFNTDPSGLLSGLSFFSLLIAAFQWGLRLGLRIALSSALLVACVGTILSFSGPDFEFGHVSVGIASSVLLGYVTAALEGRALTLKSQLAFMKDVTHLSNPRFGVDRTIGMFMERLRAFHDSDACMLVMPDQGAPGHHLRRVDRRDPERGMQPEPLPEELARLLLALPADHAVLYHGAHSVSIWWQQRPKGHTYDVMRRQCVEGNEWANEILAATLEAVAFVTVPLHYHRQAIGRLYLIRRRAFEPSDVDFLIQVIEHTMPAIHHIRLVDQLAANVAEAERRRIALDLHDSVIQPYIWLCIGLRAVQQKLAAGDTDGVADLQRLLDLTNNKVEELRQYTQGLEDKGEHIGAFLPAVRRFTDRFSEVTGISVQIRANKDFRLNDRLAAEAFQMVTEGLSNILRHTRATYAFITLAQSDGYFTLQIANDGAALMPFTPRSLTERASALGGQVRIERQGDESTVVVIKVPL
jgi:signal transduction histidine kinase